MAQGLTKSEAREWFGYVPKNKRKEPNFLQSIAQSRGMAVSDITKNVLKEMIRTEIMPTVGRNTQAYGFRQKTQIAQKRDIEHKQRKVEAKEVLSAPKKTKQHQHQTTPKQAMSLRKG